MFTFSKVFKCVLLSFLHYFAQVEKMGISRAPGAVYSPKTLAAESYQNRWDKSQKNIIYPDGHS